MTKVNQKGRCDDFQNHLLTAATMKLKNIYTQKYLKRQHFKICNDENNRAYFDLDDKLAFISGSRSSLYTF